MNAQPPTLGFAQVRLEVVTMSSGSLLGFGFGQTSFKFHTCTKPYSLPASVVRHSNNSSRIGNMNFNNIDYIKKAGFEGFKTMKELFEDSSQLPAIKGVYLILNLDTKTPSYLQVGTGGHFKGKNPNITIPELKSNWVDKTIVIYIGKAGSDTSSATLK